MATYAMKDAANLTIIDKATGRIFLYSDYVNATNAEYKADRVYAKKKNNNAVAFDSGRQGTLTIESEIFDNKLLAMVMGSDIEEGEGDIFKKERLQSTVSKQLKLSFVPKEGTLSIFQLNADGISHKVEVLEKVSSGDQALSMPQEVAVTAKDKTATITWNKVDGAATYILYRDGSKIADVATNSYNDTDLVPETKYKYSVRATSPEKGQSPLSAEVEVTTTALGTEQAGATVKATEEAKQAAQKAATATTDAALTYELKEGGLVQLSDAAPINEDFVAYYETKVQGASKLTISATKFPKSFEIYADAQIRQVETGEDHFAQVHYMNARPQSDFTFNQSSKEPTSLSIKVDLFPDENNSIAEYTFID